MKKKFLCLIAAALVPIVTICACSENNSEDITQYKLTIYNTFGTEADLRLNGDFNSSDAQTDAQQFGTDVKNYLTELEEELDAATEAFNGAAAGETVTLSENAYNVLSLALKMYNETDGYYNAGVYYLVDLFGFSSRFNTLTYSAEYKEEYDRTYTVTGDDGSVTTYATATELPDSDYITAFCELCTSFGDIVLDETYHTATKPLKTVTVNGTEYSLKIDLGGIAKGYAADSISADMQQNGYGYGYFSFGSSSMYIGKYYYSEEGSWTLGVRNPRGYSDDYYAYITAKDVTVSTSGDYERYYLNNSVRFCHIINPVTGLPVNVSYNSASGGYTQTAGIISATVLGSSAAENDARTTALMAMGLDRAIEYINSDTILSKELQIFMIYRTAEGELQLITNVADGGYTLANTQNFTLACSVDAQGKVTYTG